MIYPIGEGNNFNLEDNSLNLGLIDYDPSAPARLFQDQVTGESLLDTPQDFFSGIRPDSPIFTTITQDMDPNFDSNRNNYWQHYHDNAFNNFEDRLESSYNTSLDPEKELEFNSWKSRQEQELDERTYDYRGLFKSLAGQDIENKLLPEEYAKPSHPFFSEKSIYNNVNGNIGGKWEGNKFSIGSNQYWNPTSLNSFSKENYPLVEINKDSHLPKYPFGSPFSEGAKDLNGIINEIETAASFEDQFPNRTWDEALREWVNPNEKNGLLESVASVGGTIGGAKLGANIGFRIGAFFGPIGMTVGTVLGTVVGGVVGNYFGGTVATVTSGDYRRRQEVLLAQTNFNAGNYANEQEKQQLLNTISTWSKENQIDQIRKQDQNMVTSIVDGILDTVTYAADFYGGGKIVTMPIKMQKGMVNFYTGISNVGESTALTRGQMGLAKSLNPASTEVWIKTANELAEASAKGVKFSPTEKAVAGLIFTGPLRVTRKQSEKILKNLEGLSDVEKGRKLPQLLQQQVYRNQANWINHGDKIVDRFRRNIKNPGIFGAQVGARLATKIDDFQEQEFIDYTDSATFNNETGKWEYDESIKAAPARIRRGLEFSNTVLIETFTGDVLSAIGKAKWFRKSIAPVFEKVIANPAVKLAGATGIPKALKAIKNTRFGKQLTDGSRFQKLLNDQWAVNNYFVELGEEYLEFVTGALYDFDKSQRVKEDKTYAESLFDALLSPVQNPRQWVITAAVVGAFPVGAATIGTLTGSQTREEARKFNTLMRRLYNSQTGAVTQEQAAELVTEIYGEGQEIYNSVTGKFSLLRRLIDPAGSRLASSVFGKNINEFRKAVDKRAAIIAKQQGTEVNSSITDKAISQITSEAIIFQAVVKDKDAVDYYNKLINAPEGSGVEILADTNADGQTEIFVELLETEVNGKVYKFVQMAKKISADTKAQRTSEAKVSAALETKQIIVTKTGKIQDVKTKKFISLKEAERRGVEAERKKLTDVISKQGEILESFTQEEVDAEARKKLISNSKVLNKNLFRKYLAAKREGDTEKANSLQAQIRSLLIKQLGITIRAVTPSKTVGTGKDAKTYLTGKSKINAFKIEQDLNNFIDSTAEAIDKDPSLNIRSISKSIFLGNAAATTGRSSGQEIIEAMNVGKNIYISGLAFANDATRVFNEESRETDIKSKYGGKAKITGLANKSVLDIIEYLQSKVDGDDSDTIRKALDLLNGQNTFESFVQLSQAFSGEGKKVLEDIISILPEDLVRQFNAAIYAEYSDVYIDNATKHMSGAEKIIARQDYSLWEEGAGTQALQDYKKIKIPREQLSLLERQRLDETEVKQYDPKTDSSKSYFFTGDGFVDSDGNKVVNKKLIQQLNKRLQDKQKPIKETRGRKNLKRLEKTEAAVQQTVEQNLEEINKIYFLLVDRLENKKLNLTPDQVAATELVIEEILKLKEEYGYMFTQLTANGVKPITSSIEAAYKTQIKFREFIDNNPMQDITFSTSSFEPQEIDGHIDLEKILEDADPETLYDSLHESETGRNAIAAFIKTQYGMRNGGMIIWQIRKSDFIRRIAEDEVEFDKFRTEARADQDSLIESIFKQAINTEYKNPYNGEMQSVTYEDVYEFWRMSQSYHLFPFIKVKKVTDRKTGNEVPKLFISNEYKSLDILKRNIIVSMLGDTGKETIQSYSESVTENDFYLLLEDILQIDVRVLKGYDAEINQAIIKNFTKPKNASDSVRQHLEKVLSKGQNSIFNLIKPLLLSEVQFKTNFQNVEGMETTGIRGDSHFNNSIPRILETIDQSLATRREQELFIAFLDYESRQTQASGQIGNLDNQQQEVFIQSIKFFDSKYYYQQLPRFAEKPGIAMAAQNYFGVNKKDLLKEAKKTQEWIKNNISTEAGRLFHVDPVEFISKLKTDFKGNIKSIQDVMDAHQVIHMPKLIDAMVGDISAYVVADPKKVGVNIARYRNTINFIARHSQVSTDGIESTTGFNVINISDPVLTEYDDAQGLDGQMMLTQEALNNLLEDFGQNLHTGNSSSGLPVDENGEVSLESIKAHISNADNKERVLIKVNMLHSTLMQEASQRNGKSQLDPIIKKINAYNKGKPFDQQIHGVAFTSGAKFFPGAITNIEEEIDESNILRNQKVIRSTNLRKENSATSTNKILKQQMAQMGSLNASVTINTPGGLEIEYSFNGLKANLLKTQLSKRGLDSFMNRINSMKSEDLINPKSPTRIKEAVLNGENLFDPRYEKYLFEQIASMAKGAGIPRVPRLSLQVLGGLLGTPRSYGEELPGGYFASSHIKANIKNARYNTLFDEKGKRFSTRAKAVEYIKRNRKFFYDMFFIDSNGYPTNEVMEHELIEDTENGAWIIPGEYVLQTRVPAGSIASHSFGRLTEPASKKFANLNVSVTNEGIRIAKGADMDGDEEKTHLFARTVDTSIPNGMYGIKNNKLILKNPNGNYNLVIEFDGDFAENETATESNESLINRSLALEFAIWHTNYTRRSYDISGDIPKAAVDADLVTPEITEENVKDINISTSTGLNSIHNIFSIRAGNISIIAKTNTTYSYLASAFDDSNEVDLLNPMRKAKQIPGLDIRRDLRNRDISEFSVTLSNGDIIQIPERLEFNNMFAVKRALEIILNKSLDDNKEGKLFFMNLTPDTAGIASVLLMTNITVNDLPKENNLIDMKDAEGNYVYEAFKETMNVLKYMKSDAMKILLPRLQEKYQKYLDDLPSWLESGLFPPAFDIEYANMPLLLKEGEFITNRSLNVSETEQYFVFHIWKLAKDFQQLGNMFDLAFDRPKTITEAARNDMTLFDNLTPPSQIIDDFPAFTNGEAVISTPVIIQANLMYDAYVKLANLTPTQRFLNKLPSLPYVDLPDSQNVLMDNNIKELIILNGIRSLSPELNITLENFLKKYYKHAKELVNKNNTSELFTQADMSNKFITEYLEINDKGKVSLKPMYKNNELTNPILRQMEKDFKNLSLNAKITLYTSMVIDYGLNATSFKGSILDVINSDFSKKINNEVNNSIIDLVSNPGKTFWLLSQYKVKKGSNLQKKIQKAYYNHKDKTNKDTSSGPNKNIRVHKTTTEEKVKIVEVSSAGDSFGKKFSAFTAKLKDGRTIEEAYQLDIKGYRQEGYTVLEAKRDKGVNAPNQLNDEQLEEAYDNLWRVWATENPKLMKQLMARVKDGFILNDKFAPTGVSQARSLTKIVNELIALEQQKESTKRKPTVIKDNEPQSNLIRNKTIDTLPEQIDGIKTLTYAGIGSRATPKQVQKTMAKIAKALEKEGYTLRSGGALGADKAFESGVVSANKKEIFYEEDATDETRAIAIEVHPRPDLLQRKGPRGLDLMARNTYQVFGRDLDSPVDFVLVWTKEGEVTEADTLVENRRTGGSGQAIRLAHRKGIPVINLANKGWEKELRKIVDNNKEKTLDTDISYSVTSVNLVPISPFEFNLDVTFSFENRLLNHPKLNLFVKGTWTLEKMLKEAQVPSKYIKYIVQKSDPNEKDMEVIIDSFKEIFKVLKLNVHISESKSSSKTIKDYRNFYADKEVTTSDIKNNLVVTNNKTIAPPGYENEMQGDLFREDAMTGIRLPYSEVNSITLEQLKNRMNVQDPESSTTYRILTLSIDDLTLDMEGNTNGQRSYLNHGDMKYDNMISWLRVNVTKPEIELLEIQSELYQHTFKKFQEASKHAGNKNAIIVADLLAEKNTWAKISTEALILYADKVEKTVNFPTRNKVSRIEQFPMISAIDGYDTLEDFVKDFQSTPIELQEDLMPKIRITDNVVLNEIKNWLQENVQSDSVIQFWSDGYIQEIDTILNDALMEQINQQEFIAEGALFAGPEDAKAQKTVYNFYRKIIKHAEDFTDSNSYVINESLYLARKSKEDVTWSNNTISFLLDTLISEYTLDLKNVNFSERNAIVTSEILEEFYRKNATVFDVKLDELLINAGIKNEIVEGINYGIIAKDIIEQARTLSATNLERVQYDLETRLSERHKSIIDLKNRFPNLFINGRQRIITYIVSQDIFLSLKEMNKLNEGKLSEVALDIQKYIEVQIKKGINGDQNYAMKLKDLQDILIEHEAIEESLANNKVNQPNSFLLQTNRKKYTIDGTQKAIQGEFKVIFTLFDIIDKLIITKSIKDGYPLEKLGNVIHHESFYNIRGNLESVKDFHTSNRLKQLLTGLKPSSTQEVFEQTLVDIKAEFRKLFYLSKGSAFDQFLLMKNIESMDLIGPESVKLQSSLKKFIRLINGNPTKFEMSNNDFDTPYADVPFDEITMSSSFVTLLHNVKTVNYSHNVDRLGTQGMQDFLIHSARTHDQVVHEGITLINNLRRLTGGLEYYENTLDDKGNIKIIRTNAKRKKLGYKMRKVLTYLVEHYDAKNPDAWKNIQLIDPETIEDNERVTTDKKTLKKYIYRNKTKVFFPTLGELVAEIEAERQEIGPHLLSFKEQDLESSINQVRIIFDRLHEVLNNAISEVDGSFVDKRKNYVPHLDLDFRFTNIDQDGNKRETAQAEFNRKYQTFSDLFNNTGALPQTLDVAELGRVYVRTTALRMKNRLAISGMSVITDVDLMPMMMPTTVKDKGLLSEEAAKGVADRIELALKYIDPDITLSKRIYKNQFQRLDDIVSQINPSKYGYVKIQTNFKDIKEMWVKEGTAVQFANHIFKDRVRINNPVGAFWWKVLTDFNMLAKIGSVSFSLFHPYALYESYTAVMGRKKTIADLTGVIGGAVAGFTVGGLPGAVAGSLIYPVIKYKKFKQSYARMAMDPTVLGEWKGHGLKTQVGYAPDMEYERYHSLFKRVALRMKRKKVKGLSKIPIVAEGLQAVGFTMDLFLNFKHKTDLVMWEVMLPTMKIQAANMLYLKATEEFENRGVAVDTRQLKNDIAQFVNDAFGGQEWEQYANANPAMLEKWYQVMFAPDWTISALNIAGVSHLGLSRILSNQKGFLGEPPTSEFHRKTRFERYWVNFVAIMLVGLPNILQKLIYEAAKAEGFGDEEDEEWCFNNEKGQRLSVDITPFLRMIDSKYAQTGSSGKRRIYLRWGKQAYEVFGEKGWLANPINAARGKISMFGRLAYEQVVGEKAPGWRTAWADSNVTFLPSFIAVDGDYTKGRLYNIAEKFLPMGYTPILKEYFGKEGAQRPPAWFSPARLGSSETKIVENIEHILTLYAEGSLDAKLKRYVPPKNIELLIAPEMDAARKNGYDTDNVWTRSISAVRTKYYDEFFKGLLNDDEKRTIEAAKRLNMLKTPFENLKKSLNAKYKRRVDTRKTGMSDSKLRQAFSLWSAGNIKAQKAGVNNPYVFR
ncbi:MAG: hypothetical protein GOVbin4551_37 [Prokaryotic dsDNA virus sp.]|nr:MAG: hypothetical protein GOVbin4551_37 [Prokaryotic dsDNA virus sp.]